MIALTAQERRTLAALGLAGLAGLGVLMWQQQRAPLGIASAPTRAQAARWERQLQEARRLDVNTASAAALERLPEVGPALAQRIVDDRRLHGPFHTPEALMRVKGIGPKTYDTLQDYVKGEE